jgi:hypothetical protein
MPKYKRIQGEHSMDTAMPFACERDGRRRRDGSASDGKAVRFDP